MNSHHPSFDGIVTDPDHRAASAAQRLLGDGDLVSWSHRSFVLATVHLVGVLGARAAYDAIDDAVERHQITIAPSTTPGSHRTLLGFYVWVVDRFLATGLTTLQILGHPMAEARAPFAWYPADTLGSEEARRDFRRSPLALPNEPSPVIPAQRELPTRAATTLPTIGWSRSLPA